MERKHTVRALADRIRRDGLAAVTESKDTNLARLAKAMNETTAALRRDLGDDLSQQQEIVLDRAVRNLCLLEVLDAYLWAFVATEGRLWTGRPGKEMTVLPILTLRKELENGLMNALGKLGLKRQQKPVEDFKSYLQKKAEAPSA